MNWTLEYDGSEKALADWGITDSLPFEFSNQARSLVDIITVDGFDDAFQWNYGARVIIRRDRNGSGTSWSGGRRWFIGYVAEPRRLAAGPRQNHRYTLFDWWWLAERTVFRRLRKSFTGLSDGHPVIATLPPSEVVLFENQLEEPIDQALQLFELISFFNECWNPTRRGATSGIDPAQDVIVDGEIECDLQCPRYPVRDVTVSEALQTVLAWTQDAVIETDYDAEVPIVSVRRKANMPAAVVHFSTERTTSLNLKPRHDLVIPGVMLVWKKLHTQDGVTGLQLVKEKYPPDLSDYHPDARVHTIDLLGSMTNTLRQPLKTVVVDADHPEAGVVQHAWWAKKLVHHGIPGNA